MDATAQSRLSGTLRSILGPVKVDKIGWVEPVLLIDGRLTAAAKIVAQQKKRIVADDQAKQLLYDAINFELRKRGIKREPREALSAIFSAAEFEAFCADVAAFVASLPRKVEVTAPFPYIEGLSSTVEVLPQLRLEHRPGRTLLGQGLGRQLAISSVEAIPTWMFSNETVARGFDNVRTLLGIWRALEVLAPQSPLNRALLGLKPTAPLTSYEIIDVETALDITSQSPEVARRAAFVASMAFDKPKVLALIGKPLVSGEAVQELVRQTVGDMFSDEDLRSETSQIESASHWLFESELADDEVSGFVFACIGIDAIAGGGDANQPLSQRIADRASYLLCRRPSSRSEMVQTLTRIFKTRGKIVHGQIRKLEGDDLRVARSARGILALLIRKEISNLLS